MFISQLISPSRWYGTLIGIRKDAEIVKRRKEVDGVNVLMMGFDSLSRNAFIRKLPKAYDYLTNVLHADVLKGYNIIGDGTPQVKREKSDRKNEK